MLNGNTYVRKRSYFIYTDDINFRVIKKGLTEIETISGPIECNYTTGNWKADFDSGKINQAISDGSRMYCNGELWATTLVGKNSSLRR